MNFIFPPGGYRGILRLFTPRGMPYADSGMLNNPRRMSDRNAS